jgi:hypothetical protein
VICASCGFLHSCPPVPASTASAHLPSTAAAAQPVVLSTFPLANGAAACAPIPLPLLLFTGGAA